MRDSATMTKKNTVLSCFWPPCLRSSVEIWKVFVRTGKDSADDDNTEVLYFTNAKATFYSFTDEAKVFEF